MECKGKRKQAKASQIIPVSYKTFGHWTKRGAQRQACTEL